MCVYVSGGVCSPVVGLPEELYVDQIRGFGDALSVRLHQVCVGAQLLLQGKKEIC